MYKGMEPTQLVALSLMGDEPVSKKGMELAQLVALSLVGGQLVLKKSMRLRQLCSLSPSKRTGLLKQRHGAVATWLVQGADTAWLP